MTAASWKQLANEKYINVETYRRDGTPVLPVHIDAMAAATASAYR